MAVDTDDLYWAAGFLEGEGSFTMQSNGVTPRIQAAQVELDPLIKLIILFGGAIYRQPDDRPNKSDCFYWYVGGSRAVGVMMTLYNLFGTKRKGQIFGVLAKWKRWKKS